jgi:hypothetical protein
VQSLGLCPGLLEGKGGFHVAIGPGSTENNNVGRGHRRVRELDNLMIWYL